MDEEREQKEEKKEKKAVKGGFRATGDIVKCCVWNSLGGDPNFLYSIHETDTANHLW